MHRDGAGQRGRSPGENQKSKCQESTYLIELDMEGCLQPTRGSPKTALKQHLAQGHQARQSLLPQWCSQNSWPKHLQASCGSVHAHSDRHALLCRPLNMERGSLWLQVRHMVTGLCALLDGHAQTALQSRDPSETVQKAVSWPVWKDKLAV